MKSSKIGIGGHKASWTSLSGRADSSNHDSVGQGDLRVLPVEGGCDLHKAA